MGPIYNSYSIRVWLSLPHKDALCSTVVDGHTLCLGACYMSQTCYRFTHRNLFQISNLGRGCPQCSTQQEATNLCFIASLFRCFVVPLFCCFAVSLFHFANYHKPWTGVHQRVIWLGVKIPIPGNIYMYMYSTVHCRLSTKIVRYVVYILQFFTLKFCPDSESHSGKVQFYQAEQYYLKVVSPHTIILVCI